MCTFWLSCSFYKPNTGRRLADCSALYQLIFLKIIIIILRKLQIGSNMAATITIASIAMATLLLSQVLASNTPFHSWRIMHISSRYEVQ